MRHILLATAAAAILATSAQANCAKSNWSVGLQAGWQGTNGKLKDVDGDKINDSRYNSAPIALTLDWTKSAANSWLYGFGIEAGYVAGNPSSTKTDAGLTTKSALNPGIFAAANARLGWDFGNKWALYGLISGRALKVKSVVKQTVATLNREFRNNDTVFGFGVGAGVQVDVAERVSLGLEYRHYWDQSIKAKNDLGRTAGKIDLGSNLVLAKLSYKF